MGLTLPADRRRRTLLLVAALAALGLVVVLVVRLAAGGPDTSGTAFPTGPTAGPTADPAATPRPTPSSAGDASDAPTGTATDAPADPAAPTQEPAGQPTATGPAGELAAAVEEIEAGQEHLPPVEAGEMAEIGQGVTVTLERVERVEAQASGPGEVSGPALALTVAVTNGGTGALTLDDVVVNLYGQDGAPGSLFSAEPRTRPLAGELAPGARATGTYVLSVPPADDGRLIVSVSVATDVATPLFTTALEEF